MYTQRKARDPGRIIPIEHMISAIAYPVADYINQNTNFGRAASSILNNAALVQMYTHTTTKNNTITITKLEAKYPGEAVTGVVLDASKVYFSTGGKGNYTFTILKNGAKETDVNPMADTESDTDQPSGDEQELTNKLDAVSQGRLKGPGVRAAKSTAAVKTDVATLGRAKRQ